MHCFVNSKICTSAHVFLHGMLDPCQVEWTEHAIICELAIGNNAAREPWPLFILVLEIDTHTHTHTHTHYMPVSYTHLDVYEIAKMNQKVICH